MYQGHGRASSVTPIRVLACMCSCGHILFKCRETLPGPSANSWPTVACPVCCQTDWQGSLQAGRANGLAYFGCSMITDCFPDLDSSSNISCSNPGQFPSTACGSTILRAGGADCQPVTPSSARQTWCQDQVPPQVQRNPQDPFSPLPQPILTPTRANTEQALAVPEGMVAATGPDAIAVEASQSSDSGCLWSGLLRAIWRHEAEQSPTTRHGWTAATGRRCSWGSGAQAGLDSTYTLFFVFSLECQDKPLTMKRTNPPPVIVCVRECACVRTYVCVWDRDINSSVDCFTTLEKEWSSFQQSKSCHKCVTTMYSSPYEHLCPAVLHVQALQSPACWVPWRCLEWAPCWYCSSLGTRQGEGASMRVVRSHKRGSRDGGESQGWGCFPRSLCCGALTRHVPCLLS